MTGVSVCDMRRYAAGLLCAAGLALLVGCSGTLAGHWRMVEVQPNRQVFCIDDVTFARDGSYSATTTLKGKTLEESGRYKFNGFKLTLWPDAGGCRQYDALLKFNELEILDAKKTPKQMVILKKD